MHNWYNRLNKCNAYLDLDTHYNPHTKPLTSKPSFALWAHITGSMESRQCARTYCMYMYSIVGIGMIVYDAR